MKKTVSINLNSFVFVIDEDAYNMLHIYLSKLEEHFSKIEEGGEIVKDIETRISEIFNQKINDSKHVINISDVEEVIAILGNVEDITGDDENEEKETETKETKKSKKLYRDPDTKLLAGVCSGLAEYTGISVIFWRILFLVLLFAGQVGIIAYIILWIAVPEAKTTAQKIEMKGGKITLSSIEKTVKEEFDSVKKNFRKLDNNSFSKTVNNIFSAFMSILTVLAQVFGKILGVVFLIGGAGVIAALTLGLISVGKDNIVYTNDFISMIWLPGVLEYITTPETAWFFSISILVVFLIPVIAIISWGVVLLFDVKSNKYVSLSLLAVWVIAIIFSAISAVNMGSSFRSVESKKSSAMIVTDSTGLVKFTLNPAMEPINMSDDEIDGLNDFHISVDNHFIVAEGESLKSTPEIRFYVSEDSLASMEIKHYARGANKQLAEENIKLISYSYTNDTSNVCFDPYFKIKSKLWRNQQIQISVNLPVGTSFIFDKKMAKMVDIEDVTDKFDEDEMAGKELLVTKQGFVIK